MTRDDEYSQEWRAGIARRLDDLTEAQNRTNVAIQRIESAIISRTDFESALATRVSKEAFEGERQLVWAAIKGLQTGPAGVRAWILAAVAVLSLLLTFACGSVSLLVQLWPLLISTSHP